MPKNAIINFAQGAWYPAGQQRLFRSLVDVKFFDTGDVFIFNNEKEIKCPPHREVPYAFKAAAFNHVAALGYTSILWCDAAVWAHKPLKPVFDHIRDNGHILFTSGFNCAQWTSDACLNQMGVLRDDAEKMSMYMACCMGLDLTVERSVEFLRQLTKYAQDGISFKGDWHNDRHQVSNDPRCHGHRHDQSVGSVLANKMEMGQTVGHETFFQYYNNSAGVPYKYRQPNDLAGIRDSVVLLSQGM